MQEFFRFSRNNIIIENRGNEGRFSDESEEIGLEKFYRWLLSSEWSERLKAYAYIETDLRLRDCYVLNDDKWNDMKMLVGQILSIHFKKYPAESVLDFSERIVRLYEVLIRPLSEEQSKHHRFTMKLLMDIYDEDDKAAQQEIRQYFVRKDLDEKKSVLESLFNCYEAMMERVRNRYQMAAMA